MRGLVFREPHQVVVDQLQETEKQKVNIWKLIPLKLFMYLFSLYKYFLATSVSLRALRASVQRRLETELLVCLSFILDFIYLRDSCQLLKNCLEISTVLLLAYSVGQSKSRRAHRSHFSMVGVSKHLWPTLTCYYLLNSLLGHCSEVMHKTHMTVCLMKQMVSWRR